MTKKKRIEQNPNKDDKRRDVSLLVVPKKEAVSLLQSLEHVINLRNSLLACLTHLCATYRGIDYVFAGNTTLYVIFGIEESNDDRYEKILKKFEGALEEIKRALLLHRYRVFEKKTNDLIIITFEFSLD